MFPTSFRPSWRPLLAVALLVLLVAALPVVAQTYPPPTYSVPPAYPAPVPAPPPAGAAPPLGGYYLAPPQLEDLVARIALYPDDLIGIILPAATVPQQVVAAAGYLDVVRSDPSRAPDPDWDDAVVALLNYPDVVNMMYRDLDWTAQLGAAVVNQQADVVSAVGRFRQRAQAAGNLRSDARQVVEYQQDEISIRPANPQIIYVPYYQPAQVVVYQPQPVFGYFPRPCPVYYFNYTSGYPAGFSRFWGVSSMFTIGWGANRVRRYDYDYFAGPWYDQPRAGFFYRRTWRDRDGDRGRHDRDWRGHDRGGRDYGPGRRSRERDWEPRRQVSVGNAGRGSRDDRPDRVDRARRDFRPGGSAAGAAGPSPAQRQRFTAPTAPRATPARRGDDAGARQPRAAPGGVERGRGREAGAQRDFARPDATPITPRGAPGAGPTQAPRGTFGRAPASAPQRVAPAQVRPAPPQQMQRYANPPPRPTMRDAAGPPGPNLTRPSRTMQRDFQSPPRGQSRAATGRSGVGPAPPARGGNAGRGGGGRGQRD